MSKVFILTIFLALTNLALYGRHPEDFCIMQVLELKVMLLYDHLSYLSNSVLYFVKCMKKGTLFLSI